METVYLLLGTNLGDCPANLKSCLSRLASVGNITAISSVYQSKAWGNLDQPDFFNQAVALQTSRSPEEFLSIILRIEQDLGRVREMKWGPRVMDIDILLFGGCVIQSEKLIVPHPFLPDRRFALTALSEIADELVHPVLQKNISELLRKCEDPIVVNKISLAGI